MEPDALAIDVGIELGALLVPPLADALLDRIGEVRRALAGDIGVVLPGVRLRDDMSRDPATYAIRVRDSIVGEGRVRLDRVLAVADERILAALGGERVREPVYGMAATWLEPQRRESAMEAGALVFDTISVVGSHLAEIARTHAPQLLGRQELHTLIEHLRGSVPSLVKEIGNEGVPLATVHRVFEALLQERVWPRDPVATLEALIDGAASTRDPADLTEAVRRKLVAPLLRRRAIPALEALLLDSAYEAQLQAWLVQGTLAPHPETALHLRTAASRYLTTVARERAALVCNAGLRAALAEFFRRFDVQLDVFSYAELPPELELRPALILKSPPSVPGALAGG